MGGTHSAADAAAAWEKLAQGLRMLPPAASCCGAQATLGAGSTSSMDEAARVLFSSGAAGAQTAELLASACLAQLQVRLHAMHDLCIDPLQVCILPLASFMCVRHTCAA